MSFEIDAKRQAVIDAVGHVLVLGGPGAGKTTLALLKAKPLLVRLKPGQKVLFLSFSRAAVQQILARCREALTRDERKLIDARTYHAFCWDLLHSHGRALRGELNKEIQGVIDRNCGWHFVTSPRRCAEYA